ncbi:MAG: AAA family ATPase [Oscillospiraceae bacterium]|nr:AAA family ATPase [Oscillospiraceae bacterium]
MKEIVNSNLLKMILENAASVGDGSDSYATAEKIMVVTIDHVEKYGDMGQDSSFVKLIRGTGISLSVMRNVLMKHIRAHPVAGLADKIYMQKILMAAKNKVAARNGDMITLSDVVECIFADPSGTIKVIVNNGNVPEEDPIMPIDYISEYGVDIDEDLFEVASHAEEPKPENAKTWLETLVLKVKEIRTGLLGSVFGQDNAVSTFATGFFQAEMLAMTDKSRVRPGATFLFAGPPGVGKTFLAEKAAEALGRPFMRFDMSEYADKEANIEFCGSDKVYKNGKAGNVTSFVEKNPCCVLLFDEIEKAHINVIHLFLQLLDAGRLRDNYTDAEVSFSQAILIFTTNAGRQLYENSESGDFSGVSRKVILKALQNDVNPETGVPYFPAAICSRFASGNVVMFNRMASHNLRDIAKREVLRHAENFENEIGIDVDIDEKVFTALLFAEGGAADARTVRSRAETFFDDELFELFRLVTDKNGFGGISGLDKISMTVELPENAEIRALFENTETHQVLLFGEELKAGEKQHVTAVQTVAEGKEVLSKYDIQMIVIDPLFGETADRGYLNLEDVNSPSRDFFKFVRENYRDIPVYLVQNGDTPFGDEVLLSYTKLGVRGVINAEDGAEKIAQVCDNIHQQRSMNMLAKANKLVSFETAQYLTDEGKTAVIKLFDFEMSVAVDPEDGQNVLSGVSKPNVKFDDIIGADDAKKELQYFVEYLKNPKKFLGTGVKAPKGVLLYGPPGTGKTMLAKAMASESDVTFIAAEGNQFLKKFVGEGADRVHELFRTARKYAPAILFIDEIDAIAKERRGGDHGAGSEETLTAFLTEIDGFKNDPSKPVFVLAATNFDVEPGKAKSLDPALMRRFDRRVHIDLPDRDGRTKYIKMQMAKNEAFAVSESEIDNIAMRSTGMSLAELESVMELALRTAIRSGELKVTDEILEDAFETFNSGEEKAWDISQLERVARHEAGHAFICWHSGECPTYLTIVARGDHGGYMQHADNEGKAIYTKDELLAKIRTSLGGRASEIVYYGEKEGISTGAGGDLEAATRTAQHIICTYGMDEAFGLAVIDPQNARSGELSVQVRDAVNKMLDEEMKRAIALISENKAVIDALVSELMKKNHLNGKEIDAVLSQKV